MIYLVIIFFYLTFFSCVDNISQSKNNSLSLFKKSSIDTLCDFNIHQLKVNNVNVFNIPRDSLVKVLRLNFIEKENEIQKFIRQTNVFLLNINDEIVFIRISDSLYTISNPELSLKLTVSKIKELYPNQYSKKRKSEYRGMDAEEMSFFDCENNELRVYFMNDKIVAIIYLAAENPREWE